MRYAVSYGGGDSPFGAFFWACAGKKIGVMFIAQGVPAIPAYMITCPNCRSLNLWGAWALAYEAS